MKVNQLDSLDLKMVIIEFGMCLLEFFRHKEQMILTGQSVEENMMD